MIIFKKWRLPTFVYRALPWKIGFAIVSSVLLVTGLGVGIYFIVDYYHKREIKGTFNVLNTSLANSFQDVEVPFLTINDLKDILIAQFNENQSYAIATQKDQIVVVINDALSSSTDGVIAFRGAFTLTNDQSVDQQFSVEGFKKQLRPNYFNQTVSINNQTLATAYPSDLLNPDATSFDESNQYYNLLKTTIFNMLPNKPKDLSISDFNMQVDTHGKTYNNWNGYINIKYWLNEEKYKYPAYTNYTKVNGFKTYSINNLVTNNEGYVEMQVPIEYSNIQASRSDITTELIKDIVISNLISDENTPLTPNDVGIVVNKYDVNNGRIFLRSVQLNVYEPIRIYNNVVINGFLINRPTLVNNHITVEHPYNFYNVNEITNTNLQQIVFNALQKPDGLKLQYSDLTIIILNKNVDEGTIEVNCKINDYVIEPFDHNIIISGFNVN